MYFCKCGVFYVYKKLHTIVYIINTVSQESMEIINLHACGRLNSIRYKRMSNQALAFLFGFSHCFHTI